MVRLVDEDLHEVLGQQISSELRGRLALSCSYSSKVWLVGDRLTTREQEKAELGCNRIPTGPTLKDLDMCFLTFHCLATPSKDSHPTTPACPGFESATSPPKRAGFPCSPLGWHPTSSAAPCGRPTVPRSRRVSRR
ncbi:very-long-chain aldehyde decarbonylase GL1-6-like isoform X2 [Triticum aestivum]|uniref:very-long-chain aldehyde decarbonylase GL1-6-like isoform X2 n=1 Tax=Triticum aestivum TaxID=4565 RepID=UPI001D01E4CB|nr:very-long-chain aldehyde decarbonylase GL1-6-like isoform X2 [Triticum aestivum]